jgi:hypothetical protein
MDKPITYSRRDTPETIAQIEALDAKWLCLCQQPKPDVCH